MRLLDDLLRRERRRHLAQRIHHRGPAGVVLGADASVMASPALYERA